MRKKLFIKNYFKKINNLLLAFLKKSKQDGIFSALFVSRKYIFDKGSLIMEGGVRPPLYHPDLLLQPLDRRLLKVGHLYKDLQKLLLSLIILPLMDCFSFSSI